MPSFYCILMWILKFSEIKQECMASINGDTLDEYFCLYYALLKWLIVNCAKGIIHINNSVSGNFIFFW